MKNFEQERSKIFRVVDIVDYVPDSVVTKTIIRKPTGNVTALSVDSGEVLSDGTSRFDTLLQVIDGMAEVAINGDSHHLDMGQCIIIPANARNTISANQSFKMISTTIKSGYEDVIV